MSKHKHLNPQQHGRPEQPTRTESVQNWTTLNLDFWDRMRLLFGARIQVKVTMNIILPAGASIKGATGASDYKVSTRSTHSFAQDRPRHGHVEFASSSSQMPTRNQIRLQKKLEDDTKAAVNKELKGTGMEVDKIEPLQQ